MSVMIQITTWIRLFLKEISLLQHSGSSANLPDNPEVVDKLL